MRVRRISGVYPNSFIYTPVSLSATVLRNRIIGALRSSEDTNAQRAAAQVSQNFVFDHPTICQLSDAISTLVDPSSISVAAKDPVDEIKRFLDKYANGLSRRNLPTPPISQTGAAVLLTGSTGNLGSHIVAALLSDERVSKVYTFDRSVSGTSPLQRLELAFEDRGLSSSLLSTSKLVSLTGDLNEASFGLDEATYDEVRIRSYLVMMSLLIRSYTAPELVDAHSAQRLES